ncbi:hypothetical protein BO218_16060 [Microbacterium paludicola]|nr:hypothetical protein BO218_16060 [Microbacterium paludicola]
MAEPRARALAPDRRSRQASITQQYVKNVLQQACEKEAKSQEEVEACFRSTTVASGTDGIERKLQEMRYAIQLEKRYPKNEILLGYLNIAHFGGTVYGIGAASQYYFGVPASQLTIGQAAAIAGMVQEPNTYRLDRPDSESNGAANGYELTKDRQIYVLNRMFSDGKITQEERDAAIAEPITPNIQVRAQGCQLAAGAEFFCEYVRNIVLDDPAFGESLEERQQNLRRGGMKIYTTLDPQLQDAALDAMSVVPATDDRLNLGASGVQVEVGTGRVLSMVQNRPFAPTGDEAGTVTPVNYNVRNQDGGGGHSAGSTYKVFSLINWLEQGHSVNEVLNGRVGNKRVLTSCDGATQNVRTGNSGRANEIGNFQSSNGYSGTIKKFTEDSLNSGFLAMAERISVCSTNPGRDEDGRHAVQRRAAGHQQQPLRRAGVRRGRSHRHGGGVRRDRRRWHAVRAEGHRPRRELRGRGHHAADELRPGHLGQRRRHSRVRARGRHERDGSGRPNLRWCAGVRKDRYPRVRAHLDGRRRAPKVATVVWVGNVDGFAKLNEYV